MKKLGELRPRNSVTIGNRNTKLTGEPGDLINLKNYKPCIEFLEKELEELGELRN